MSEPDPHATVAPPLVLLALDIDGVLNALDRAAGGLEVVEVGRWLIRYRPDVVRRLKALLRAPGLEAAWLSTWLADPASLDEFEWALGLTGLVRHRAQHPSLVADGPEPFGLEATWQPDSRDWWKIEAARRLEATLRPERFAWVDDDLGRARGLTADEWQVGRSPTRLLLRPDAQAGLLPADLDVLEDWVAS